MNIAVILAAGTGSRMGNADKPKQFLLIYNKPLIVHTIEAFEMHQGIDWILVVTNEEYIDQVKVWCKQYDLAKVKMVVAGGNSRQKSVFNGIKALKDANLNDDDVVVIHDSARPLISQEIISKNIEMASIHNAVDTVIPASDTIVKSTNKESIDSIPSRSELFQGQTPQSFKFGLIYNAHQYALEHPEINATDDCKLVLAFGKPVYLVEGSKLNFKITTFDDLMMLKALLKIGKTEVL